MRAPESSEKKLYEQWRTEAVKQADARSSCPHWRIYEWRPRAHRQPPWWMRDKWRKTCRSKWQSLPPPESFKPRIKQREVWWCKGAQNCLVKPLIAYMACDKTTQDEETADGSTSVVHAKNALKAEFYFMIISGAKRGSKKSITRNKTFAEGQFIF